VRKKSRKRRVERKLPHFPKKIPSFYLKECDPPLSIFSFYGRRRLRGGVFLPCRGR